MKLHHTAYAFIPALALCLSMVSLPTASASFGTGIGVSFPASGGHSSEIVPSYAAFSFDQVVEELTVEEKHGRLIMELKVTNDGDVPYSVSHRDGQVYDFAILDKNGKTLYRWSDGMAFTQALTSSSVDAHKSEVYTAELDRKKYRELKEDAVLVTAWLVDTPYSSRRACRPSGSSTPVTLHGGIIIGNGPGTMTEDRTDADGESCYNRKKFT